MHVDKGWTVVLGTGPTTSKQRKRGNWTCVSHYRCICVCIL